MIKWFNMSCCKLSILLLFFTELFYTERTHCRNLKILQNLFYKPMSQDPNISNELIKLLFPNLEEMIALHGKKCNSLLKRNI